MEIVEQSNADTVARWVGCSLLATIVVGVLAAVFLVSDIDINLSADIAAVAENMLEAEQRLRAKAYIALLTFGLDVLIAVGLFLILRSAGPLLAVWSLFVGLSASILVLLGAVFALNAAEFAGDRAYDTMAGDMRLTLASLQATSDYTSFHLGLILGSLAKAGFFYLFVKSRLIPALIAGWGLFASLFVAFAIVARDFVPVLGHEIVTAAFMISNLIALVSTGFYLGILGVRSR